MCDRRRLPVPPPPRGPLIYLAVLRTPGVPVPAVAAALASVPIGMLGLALLLLVRQGTGSLAAAGAVVAVFGAGVVLGMTFQGRLIDRVGPRPVLLGACALRAASSVALVTASGARPPLWTVAALAFLVGASEPQVGSALRALWPTLVGPELLPAATALSSLLFELPVMVGPLLLAAVIAVLPVEAAVLAAAAFAVSGGCVFAWSAAARGWRRRAAPPVRGLLGPLRAPAVRMIVLVISVQGATVGLMQITSAASTSATGAGLLYAVLTAGSLLGTTLYGARARPAVTRRHVPALLLGLAGSMVVVSAVPGTAVLAGCAFLFGLLAGPLGVRCFIDLERHAPPGAPAGAVTILIAAGVSATSAGSAVAGWTVEAGGAAPGMLLGAGCALVTALWLLRAPIGGHPM